MIHSVNKSNLFEQPGVVNSDKIRKIKDDIPELKNWQIRADGVEFSKEGMEALPMISCGQCGRICKVL